ncbi:MAG: hypothetical protein QOJ07_1607, partial [Thermoleophilaceae bacterium]|nr:hypothetical protein [Thermoleophilaceae bacterium]
MSSSRGASWRSLIALALVLSVVLLAFLAGRLRAGADPALAAQARRANVQKQRQRQKQTPTPVPPAQIDPSQVAPPAQTDPYGGQGQGYDPYGGQGQGYDPYGGAQPA